MTTPSRAVFLSYASQDAEAAQRICEALRAGGIEVWFDQSELRGGDLWDASIRRQIKSCGLFIPIISANTHAREEGYFRLEWKLAVDRSHLMAGTRAFLLPVSIDDTRDDDERTPDRFREVQWTRLPRGETPPEFVTRVARLLSPAQDASASVAASVATTAHAAPTAARRSRFALLLLAVAVLIGAGYLAYNNRLVAKRGYAAATPAAPSAPSVGASPEKSIAVLPFVDMSEKRDQEYFSDGLAEELIDHLTHAAGLKVIARTSSFQFKGKNEDARSIAAKLGVANLLEGSVRTAGHQMRIAAQLVRAADGADLWSQTYNREVSDIFQVQDEIASNVAEALSATLSGRSVGQERNEKNPQAYDLLLKGNYFYFRNHKGDFARAAGYFQQALALDSNYALAWAQLARTYIVGSSEAGIGAEQAEPKAREALQRALAIDPDSVAAHRWLGRIYLNFRWDWAAAARELQRAADLDPDGTEGRLARGDLSVLEALTTGRFDPGIEFALKDLSSSPLDTSAMWFLTWFPELGGRHELAAIYEQRLLGLDPDYSGAHGQAAATALALGHTVAALAEAQKEPDEETRLAVITRIYWKMGRTAEADHALQSLENKFPRDAAYDIAVAHAERAESDAALDWLERAYRQHDNSMVGLKVDQRLRPLRGMPRFQSLMKRMNFSA